MTRMLMIVIAAILLILAVGGIYSLWRIGSLENEKHRLQVKGWKDYAETLEYEAERDRQAKGVEADIDRLSDATTIERMCRAGYLTDCPDTQGD